jgi:formate hydrogenlyase subunit 4
MIQYGASLKLFLFAAILLHFVFPFRTGSLPLDWGLFIVEMMGAAVGIGVVESVMARLQMRHVPYLLTAAVLFCGFAFILFVRQF